jgi:hypothetical protein
MKHCPCLIGEAARISGDGGLRRRAGGIYDCGLHTRLRGMDFFRKWRHAGSAELRRLAVGMSPVSGGYGSARITVTAIWGAKRMRAGLRSLRIMAVVSLAYTAGRQWVRLGRQSKLSEIAREREQQQQSGYQAAHVC